MPHYTAHSWLTEFLTLFSSNPITIPSEYDKKVIAVKDALKNDTSGLVNSLLDFAISAALVDFYIETDNSNVTKLFTDWLNDVNFSLRGKIPVGIKALAKEYFRERWKGSSFLLLRTFWETKDGFYLPTKLAFVNGEDIKVSGVNSPTYQIGNERYFLKTTATDTKGKPLPSNKDEIIFVQRPYESWGEDYTTPFLIRRGLYENMRFLDLMQKKGQRIAAKALEYLLLLKKGTEKLALEGKPEFIYSQDDLTKAKDDLQKHLEENKAQGGLPLYATNFDTILEHFIPEYNKIINDNIYAPIEKKILAGLGMVEIVEGTASTRRESLLNPKPFIAEIKNGIEDFKTLLTDIMNTIMIKNEKNHTKYSSVKFIIHSTPVKEFITNEIRNHIRSAYDRGTISKRTYTEFCTDADFDIEVERRKQEKDLKTIMYPPVIQNLENTPDSNPTPTDKKSIEKKNYIKALEECECFFCEEIFDYESQTEIEEGTVLCPHCKEKIHRDDVLFFGEELSKEELEQAPYTKENVPAQIKNLPAGARSIWVKVFNSVYKNTHDETNARMAAWHQVKNKFRKNRDGTWVKK